MFSISQAWMVARADSGRSRGGLSGPGRRRRPRCAYNRLVSGARTFHDIRERRSNGPTLQVEQWRMEGGRLYEKRTGPEKPPVVRVAAGRGGVEIAENKIRKLRPAEINAWRREVRMVPANFIAHATEMEVVGRTEQTPDGIIERLEAPGERLALELDAKSGHPRRVIDLRSKKSIEFDQPRDVQGRHWPRLEIHRNVDREVFRDRIVEVEFDAAVPAEVLRLWEALEAGRMGR